MADFDVIQGNKALAYGVKLARVEVIPAYPITPQTTIIEYLAEFVANGELDAEYIHADGEHSCMAMAVGASLAGARVFTSTCSQGLAYMHECVAQAVNYRTPLLLGVANRTLGWFWSLGPDYSDIMPELNLGYLVNFAESNQEVLDMTLQLYKIAEDYRVLLPTMMSLDGFYLSYSQERVWMPDQEVVDKWLPPYKAPYPIDPTINDKFPTASIPPTMHTPMRRIYEEILQDSRAVIKEVDASFGKAFGRSYGGLVEEYRTEGAEALLVTMGSMTTAGRRAIDKLRAEGEKIGLVKLRFLRPFPDTEIREIASNVKAIGVVDRMMNHGTRGGGAFQDIKGALYNSGVKIPIQGFVTGMGGEDIPIDDMYMMGKKALAIAKAKRVEKEVEFIEHKMPPMTKPVQLDWDEPIYPASDGCAGCGASIIVRHLLKVLGPNTIVINPPNCSGVNYGQVVRVPWMLANFAAAAAYETGVYRAMKKKGKADKVWITSFAGDGGTADIGLQSLSGAAERGEPIMWLCYDNEAYMNTGIQRSSATPTGASTTTSPAGDVIPGKVQWRKPLTEIIAAHQIPYVAQAAPSNWRDLMEKARKAAAADGPAFLNVFADCNRGWRHGTETAIG
ncbi:TPA: hypothetical protein HA344_07350, partial [Candidatus Bathyarchaeota archaeon]|nr:hypothetical protein [Candidatus Bathyarchaeota archaeon]